MVRRKTAQRGGSFEQDKCITLWKTGLERVCLMLLFFIILLVYCPGFISVTVIKKKHPDKEQLTKESCLLGLRVLGYSSCRSLRQMIKPHPVMSKGLFVLVCWLACL